MDSFSRFAPTVGRIFTSIIFLAAAAGKIADPAGTAGYMAMVGLPTFLMWPSAIFELALGLGLLLGYQTRILGLLGAGFCLFTGALFHFHPEDQIQMIMLMKNIAIAGGLLYVTAFGAGSLALDKARA